MIRNVLSVLIVMFSVLYIFNLGPANGTYTMLFKLIPMILIIIFAILSEKPSKKYAFFIIIGLIFCAIGDYTLQWFIIGLCFFLTGHLFYITAFLTNRIQKTPKIVLPILLIYGVIMASIICGGLLVKNEIILAIAVLAYISIILLMGYSSWKTANKYAIIGSILFIISDSILAINRFTMDVPFSGQLIMLTYYGAQFLFAYSISKYSVFRNKVIQ